MSRALHLAVTGILLLPACKDEDDGGTTTSDPTTTTAAWLVGDSGEMRRVTSDGEASPYALDLEVDLLAIDCRGAEEAWVVGAAGTVLRTDNAGASWSPVAIGAGDLRLIDVATAEHTTAVAILAADGTVFRSPDGGAFHSTALPLEASAMATDHDGGLLVAVGEDGIVWDVSADEPLLALDDQPLRGVAIADDGAEIVAVGDGGFATTYTDAGWEPVVTETGRALLAVTTLLGGGFIAVGEGGVTVRIDDEGVELQELLAPQLSLRDVHVHHAPYGQAVGDAGTVFLTEDNGRTWSLADIGATATLRGVDDFE